MQPHPRARRLAARPAGNTPAAGGRSQACLVWGTGRRPWPAALSRFFRIDIFAKIECSKQTLNKARSCRGNYIASLPLSLNVLAMLILPKCLEALLQSP